MPQRWFEKASVQAALVAGPFLVIASIITSQCRGKNLEEENARLHDTVARWKFSAPLFKAIPGDSDFILRGVRVDKRSGAARLVMDPLTGDSYSIQISNLSRAPDGSYRVQFSVAGEVAKNRVTSGTAPEVEVRREVRAGPINAGSVDFFLFIEDVQVDYIQVAIARSPSQLSRSGLRIEGGNIPFGAIGVFGFEEPSPILQSAPQ
jgi:hypothetical protein